MQTFFVKNKKMSEGQMHSGILINFTKTLPEVNLTMYNVIPHNQMRQTNGVKYNKNVDATFHLMRLDCESIIR